MRALSIDGVEVTLSVGVSTLRPTSESSQALRQRADAALYAAKRDGRDRYAVYAAP